MSSLTWACPSCRSPLHFIDRQWQCENRHSFDCAKEGYVNLLLAQNRNSKQPGDSKAMVLARREFLQSGAYAPLANAIAQCLLTQYEGLGESQQAFYLFDAGCGEGYYLNAVSEFLSNRAIEVLASGIDISKPAIAKAAKKYASFQFAVASSYDLPLPDNSQDAIIQVFAPSAEKEIKRVLKPNGVWLTVNPGPEHLFALKQKVYDTPEKHKIIEEVPEGFSRLSQTQVQFTVSLDTQTMRENLLMMTPFYWHLSEQKKRDLIASLTQVQTDFDIQLLQACS